MIAPDGHDRVHGREIARALAAAVSAAVEAARSSADGTRKLPWSAASGVADLLELQGLAALLAACEAHADAPPRAVANVLERLSRLAAETEARGDIAPFAAAEPELAALAGVLGAQEWAAATDQEPTPESVQSLTELLADFGLDDPAAIEHAQVALPVAAGLRAALDWLGADQGGQIRVSVQDAALTLVVRVAHEAGLAPAGAVLALTSASMLPEADGRWALRVPLHAARPAFLLARQGELSLALPWHAVARLRIVDDAARMLMTEPSLEPWSPLERVHGERPAALLAQGLSRAWLHLDHIVWRVFASPEPGHAPDAVPGGRLRVRTDDGVDFWVVDLGEALRGVPQLLTPPRRRRARPEPGATAPMATQMPAGPSLTREPAAAPAVAATVEPARAPGPAAAATPEPVRPPEPVPPAASEPEPFVLTPEHVRALEPKAPPAPPAPTQAAAVLEPAPAAFELDLRDALAGVIGERGAPEARPAAPASRAPQGRRALIVDDSLVARLVLASVLEREGWWVESVERAEEMWAALRESEWSVVFADVSLPDASGSAHLRALVARQLAARHRFEVVALTRDRAEQRLVDEAGITRALRKPFAPGAVEGLIRELPAPPAGA